MCLILASTLFARFADASCPTATTAADGDAAWLRAGQDRTRRASQRPPSYDQILDDLDDDKDLTFAHIQTVCARQFRRTKERHPETSHCEDTLWTPRTSPVKT